MLPHRRSKNVAPNYISPQPAGGSFSVRQQPSKVTDREPLRMSTAHTVEAESPVGQKSPQEIPPLPPRPAIPPQLPSGSSRLRWQSTRRDTYKTHYSPDSEERNPPQPPNIVPALPLRSDSRPAPVSSGAVKNASILFRKFLQGVINRRLFPLMVIAYLLVLSFFVVALFSASDGHGTAKRLTSDGNGVGSGRGQSGRLILNDTPQVAILGDVSRFDGPHTHRLSVTWSIVGLGEYQSQTVNGSSHLYPSVNRAVDVYLDEWVKVRLIYLGITE